MKNNDSEEDAKGGDAIEGETIVKVLGDSGLTRPQLDPVKGNYGYTSEGL